MAKKSTRKKSTRKSSKKSGRTSKSTKKSTRKVSASHVRKHTAPVAHSHTGAAHELGALIIRFALGIVFLAHGAMKLFVTGVPAVAQFFASLGVPASSLMAWTVSLAEFVGGLLLIVGLFTRWAALVLAIDMFFAWLLVHAPNGYFIGEAVGYEFVLTLMLVCLGVFFHGAGLFSLEKTLLGREV